ncbi:SBF-like CPA transporter family-domain-containing protein [Syncephalastrum racemosum]|uniref:SBF-like CPA transporter family-domain-containing protein n=1 Tax=Syncephalastrum racemosum TaxID=13706 RepID=A0A1X2HCU6_SYNRA|nr:SBF-like CPA transporter family-domain-containing protein [Syncephalastrum racemosum]
MSSTIELQQPPAVAFSDPIKRNSVLSLSTGSTSETPPQHVSKHSGTTAIATHDQIRRVGQVAKGLFKQYWFLLGLGIVIGLAWAFPQVGKTDGAIDAQYTVKWGAVIVIFLLSGLGLEVKVMLRTIVRWRLHLTVQLINFVLLPLTMWGVVHFLIAVGARIDTTVYQGWMIAVSTSTTVSSNAVMTRNANGNDSGALVNAALGNILGIFISPALMSAFGNDTSVFPPGDRGSPDYVGVLRNLGCTVLLPLVVGQILRYFFPRQVKYLAGKFHFSIINSLALLCMVWSVFCDGVASNAFRRMSGVDIVAIVGVDMFMYLFGCMASLFFARLPYAGKHRWIDALRFSRKDAVAIMYCGATKTVSMGIPLINVMYSSQSYGAVGILSLPLLMYHIIQLFIGNFQVPFLKRWVGRDEEERGQDQELAETQHVPLTSQRTLPTFTRRRPQQ